MFQSKDFPPDVRWPKIENDCGLDPDYMYVLCSRIEVRVTRHKYQIKPQTHHLQKWTGKPDPALQMRIDLVGW
jgi:hypothetical protein